MKTHLCTYVSYDFLTIWPCWMAFLQFEKCFPTNGGSDNTYHILENIHVANFHVVNFHVKLGETDRK